MRPRPPDDGALAAAAQSPRPAQSARNAAMTNPAKPCEELQTSSAGLAPSSLRCRPPGPSCGQQNTTRTIGRDTVRSHVRRWLRKGPSGHDPTSRVASPSASDPARGIRSLGLLSSPTCGCGVAPARPATSTRAVFPVFLSHVMPAAQRQVNGRRPPAPVVSCLPTSPVKAPRLDRAMRQEAAVVEIT